jgi:hypothetical protein
MPNLAVPAATRQAQPMRPMLFRWLVASFVLLAAGNARAFCRLTTVAPAAGDDCDTTGMSLVWRRSCMTFSVAARSSSEPALDRVRRVVDESFATWMDVVCDGDPIGLDLRQTVQLGECLEPEYNLDGPNANTIAFIEDWDDRELPSDAFGLTIVHHNRESGEIYDADMLINETIGELAICSGACPSGRLDMQNVITHEAGHFLGLGHSSEPNATMSAHASLGEVEKRDLHADDRAGLCSIYGQSPGAMCEHADHAPDNGFSPTCWAGVERKSGCSAARNARDGRAPTAAASAFSLLWLALVVLRRRARRRVRTV